VYNKDPSSNKKDSGSLTNTEMVFFLFSVESNEAKISKTFELF
jgi:hypothetical protein